MICIKQRVKSVKEIAAKSENYERTLFIISALNLMYLRISELVANDHWGPMMKHFGGIQDDGVAPFC